MIELFAYDWVDGISRRGMQYRGAFIPYIVVDVQ